MTGGIEFTPLLIVIQAASIRAANPVTWVWD
jgi:hypothetical protein